MKKYLKMGQGTRPLVAPYPRLPYLLPWGLGVCLHGRSPSWDSSATRKESGGISAEFVRFRQLHLVQTQANPVTTQSQTRPRRPQWFLTRMSRGTEGNGKQWDANQNTQYRVRGVRSAQLPSHSKDELLRAAQRWKRLPLSKELFLKEFEERT